MNILAGLSVGDLYQNIAFYALLFLLGSLNFMLIMHPARRKKAGANHHQE
ncbi:MAG TPA: hypothetical protein VG367_05975 [Mucilaginibacter sp.]|jgi:hypothetical protein|nr:hypothetical protein [Mucilaginibacter sp.]